MNIQGTWSRTTSWLKYLDKKASKSVKTNKQTNPCKVKALSMLTICHQPPTITFSAGVPYFKEREWPYYMGCGNQYVNCHVYSLILTTVSVFTNHNASNQGPRIKVIWEYLGNVLYCAGLCTVCYFVQCCVMSVILCSIVHCLFIVGNVVHSHQF